ncbi:MAG: hypothetical protein OEV89_08095 [Desulfobulbaceae bacterium]|nr:hypothetical protein [Desulfobulbaceae bacterium]
MHNSQGGVSMAYEFKLTGREIVSSERVNEGLLITDCIGCHQGTNTGSNLVPFVLQITEPTYGATGTEGNTLAGGNFYWVSTANHRAGHNVAGISVPDDLLNGKPPGGEITGVQLTCAGTSGCHGKSSVSTSTQSIMGGHHGKDRTIGWQDGTTVAKSYRFLDGIKGLEDSDYEFQPNYSAHNMYFGLNGGSALQPTTGTISNFCARCHGNFHSSSTATAGVWLRHPVDFDMSGAVSSTEYATYNGGGTNNYSVVSPVATNNSMDTPISTVTPGQKNAIVMCLSCHRAHGTPYNAIVRWDYQKWPQAGGYNGCKVCHSTKD